MYVYVLFLFLYLIISLALARKMNTKKNNKSVGNYSSVPFSFFRGHLGVLRYG